MGYRRREVVLTSDLIPSIIRGRIWGAPDLVVEVASPGTARRDRTTKLQWYRRYGVKECWIVDDDTVRVVRFDADRQRSRRFRGAGTVQSSVLSGSRIPAEAFFVR